MFTTLKQREIKRYSLLFVFLMLCGCGGPERVPLRGGTEHLLLLHRRTLKYEERIGSETKPFTVRMFYSGGRDVRVFELQFKGVDWGRCRFISKGQLVYFETNKPFTALEDVPEFRQLWMDETAASGDDWYDPETGTQTVVAASETVTVPAGTFENCYKTVTTGSPELADSLEVWYERGEISRDIYQSQMKAARTVIVRWFASGVGLVKEQIGSPDHVRVLIAVTEVGKGKVDIETPEEE